MTCFKWIVAIAMTAGLFGCNTSVKDVATKVDFEQVHWYAKRAKAAYQSESEIRAAFPKTVRVTTVADTQVQYFLERLPQEQMQVVTVRGTDNLANFKQDANYFTEKNAKLDIFVHRGFDRDASLLYQDLLPYLDKDLPVKVTGHSLGAAISTLLMMHLHEDGFRVEQSINFGQPKVTNRVGAEAYEFLPLLRIVDENDLVPLVPPTTLLDSLHGKYEHFGQEVILLEGEYYSYLDQRTAMDVSVDSFWRNLGNESVEDHFMANYISNIEPKLDKAVQVNFDERERYIAN